MYEMQSTFCCAPFCVLNNKIELYEDSSHMKIIAAINLHIILCLSAVQIYDFFIYSCSNNIMSCL